MEGRLRRAVATAALAAVAQVAGGAAGCATGGAARAVCGQARPPLTIAPVAPESGAGGASGLGGLAARAVPDCAAGRRVLVLATTEAKVLDKLELLEQVISHGKCLVGTATLDKEPPSPWLYASWDPVDPDADPPAWAPSVAAEVAWAPGSRDWMVAADQAVRGACDAGRSVAVVLPPGLPEAQRQGLVASLRGEAGASCELVTAVFDRPAISKSTVVLTWRLPWSGGVTSYFDYERRGRLADYLPQPAEPEPPPPVPPAFTVAELPIPLADVPSRRLEGPTAGAAPREPLLSLLPRKGPAILGVFASWCKPCLEDAELDLVADLSRRARSSGAVFLNVADASGDLAAEAGKVANLLGRRPLVLPVHVAQSRLQMLPGYEDTFTSLPLFLVVRDRQVVAYRQGRLDEHAVERLARAVTAPPEALVDLARPPAAAPRPRAKPAPPAPSAAERAFLQGEALYAAGRYAEAALRLEEASRLGAPDPRTLWNIARSQALAGSCEAAGAAFEAFRAAQPDALGRSLPDAEP